MGRPARSHGHDATMFIHACAEHDTCEVFQPDIPVRVLTAPKLPELALLRAMLEQAGDDLRVGHHRTSHHVCRTDCPKCTALGWVLDDDRTDEFSFAGACAILQLDVKRTRTRLLFPHR